MFLLGFGVFEEEEVHVVLEIFVGGEILDGEGEVFRHRIDSVQIYCNFGKLIFEKGNLFWGHWKFDAADIQ